MYITDFSRQKLFADHLGNIAVFLAHVKLRQRDYSFDKLDPTQRAFVERVMKWARDVVRVYKEVKETGRQRRRPRLRLWLAGSAGSGKSTTLRTILQHVRLLFQEEDVPARVALTAYAGVVAFNIGFGAETVASMFQVFPGAAWKETLDGESAQKLEDRWADVELLIVDETSCVGCALLARMHFRLQQGKRRFLSELGKDPNKFTFGDTSIILVGDFGQLAPIDDWSMYDESARFMDDKKIQHLWKHGRYGKALLTLFDEAYVLRNIHRSKEDMWWTQSCLRLRDFEMTYEGDYVRWMEHDLDRGCLTEEQKTYFEDKAVWICSHRADVGRRNGRKLARLAEEGGELVHKISAMHSMVNSRKRPSSVFAGLRSVVHVVRGCSIVITKNIAYRYGVANGTRGTVVGVVYDAGGVGTFPEAIIVEVPDYCGPSFYADEPTWVPILPMTVYKKDTRKSRTQFPLVAGFALTIQSARGLTIKEGVVIHLGGDRRSRPASQHGVPFVAFTRSENFASTAFKHLPPFEEFRKGQESPMLQQRQAFELKLKEMHRRTLARHSHIQDEESEVIEHKKWDAMQVVSSSKLA